MRGTAGVTAVSSPLVVPLAVLTGTVSGSILGAGAGADVSSTVECLPVVHGGMARNSSKVKTRGLQHFQPMNNVN